jgi:D-aspartate ligase
MIFYRKSTDKGPSSLHRLSVLLASASTGGTLAAARHLSANGVEVRVISSQRLSAAAWSRSASRSYSAPPENQHRLMLNVLLAIGAAHPGQILLPTSDETAWLYTINAAILKRHFCVYQPSIETTRRILDKQFLAEAATRAGLAVLASWDPRNLDDLATLAPGFPYPILIKRRTHVQCLRLYKGVVVHSASELLTRYRSIIAREQSRAADDALLTGATRPILQRFVSEASEASEGVHSITGFIDRTGGLFVTRRSRKVFQRTRPLGIGVCFESLPPDPELSNAVRRLCHELGYFGIFEVEFVWFNGCWSVIDFNPRLFNQIGMDIRRGMPLPLLACLDAAGETAALRDAVAKAQDGDVDEKTVFCDRFTLRAILFAQAVTSMGSREDRAYWRAWTNEHAAHMVELAADENESMPGVIHALSEIYLGFRALPQFLLSTPYASGLMTALPFLKQWL